VPDWPAGYPDLQPDSERLALSQQLQFCRQAAVARIQDLEENQVQARPLLNTALSVGGVVKHLAWVEDRWFTGKLLGEQLPEPWASAPLAHQPDWPFESSIDDSKADIAALYAAACARSDAASAGRSLDTLAAADSFGRGPVNVRWLFAHLTTETAWHLGHLDLLRDALRVARAPG
jgi:hypothetical protein